MNRTFVLAVSALLLGAAPSWAGTLSFYDSAAGPGNIAYYAPNTGILSDIDYDADSAEGVGGMPYGGPTEILISPVGDAVLTAFTCQLAAGCDFYTFTPGGAGTGSLLISDSDSDAQSGLYELGDITWDSLGAGGLQLDSCNYTDANAAEQQCSTYLLATTPVPEPGTAALLGFALVAFGVARRRR